MNSTENCSGFLFTHGSLLDEALETVLNHLHAIVDETLLDITHRNIEFAYLGADLSYAVPHQAGT
jgi:hypothetical protein